MLYHIRIIWFTEKQTTSSLTTGATCKGVISNIKKETGLVVQLPEGGKGLIGLTDIADEYKDDPTSKFKIGQCIDCYIVSCKKKNKCYLSLRKSR